MRQPTLADYYRYPNYEAWAAAQNEPQSPNLDFYYSAPEQKRKTPSYSDLMKSGAQKYGESQVDDWITGGSSSGAAAAGSGISSAASPGAYAVGNTMGSMGQVYPAADASMYSGMMEGSSSAGGSSAAGAALQYGGGGVLTAKGIYDMNNARKSGRGMQTAGTEAGAGIGTMIMPGVGTAIGAGVGWLHGTLAEKLGRDPFLPWKTISTKTRQRMRAADLAQSNPSYAAFMQASAGNDDSGLTEREKERAYSATDPNFKGWVTNPETGFSVYVNKPLDAIRAAYGEDQGNKEYLANLGQGDVYFAPWFYENIPNYGAMSHDQRLAVIDAALKSGTAHGNAGNIDFELTPELQAYV